MGILNEVLTQSKLYRDNGITPKVYFDLDSTLFDVKPRFKKIMIEFGALETTVTRFPVAAKILTAIEQVAESYHFQDHIKFWGLQEHSHEFHKELFHFWSFRFFHSDYLVADKPYEGAVEYVTELHQLGAEIIYLTGRDTERMLKGSIESLKKWKFPIDTNGVKLILKPYKEMDDAEFKRDHFNSLNAKNTPVWFFENEPHNIHLILRDCPHVKIIFFDSVHSGKSHPPAKLPTIRNFTER